MKKSQRIKTLVDLKAAQAKSALEALGVCQRKWLVMQNQIQGLKDYRKDYQNKLDQLGSGGANILQLLEFKSFIEKLDKAIAGQEVALEGIDQELAFKKKAWENLHYRTQGLQKVCDSAVTVEAKQEDKREQLLQDERAGRFGRNNRLV
jgi:flagellar protein FliJ